MAADPVWLCVESSGHQGQAKVGARCRCPGEAAPGAGRGPVGSSPSPGTHSSPAPSCFGASSLSSCEVGELVKARGSQVQEDILISFLLLRLLESAMSGKYLHDGFTLPCPPGLKIPEEDGYTITPNTLKVGGRAGVSWGI